MKKLLLMLFAATVMFACNNAANTEARTKDSLDSVANARKDVIDSSAEQRKEQIDSTTEQKKQVVDSLDSLNRKMDSASRR